MRYIGCGLVLGLALGCGSSGSDPHDAGRSGLHDGGRGGHDGATAPETDGGTPQPGVDSGPPPPVPDAGPPPPPPPPGSRYFPDTAWMYQRIDSAPLRADSATTTQWLHDNGSWGTGRMQIDYSILVLQATASTPYLTFNPTGDFYDPDCDNVPMPVPAVGAVEGEDGYACTGDGDCHLLVVDRAMNRLYEMWRANIVGGNFDGGCLAAWDMTRVYDAAGRGEQCSSADAAGFPITPLLFTVEEVAAGSIQHAIRFILPNARMRSASYVHPGNHAGGPSGPDSAPVYGLRWRLRADFDMSTLPNDAARTVARAMQQYGIALADGGNIALTAASDRYSSVTWDSLLGPRDLAVLDPLDFEVVDTGDPIDLTFDCARTAY